MLTAADRARGLWIAVLLALMVPFALPTPLPLDERRLALPQARAEIDRWAPVVAPFGVSEEEGIAALRSAIRAWRRALGMARAPLRPLLGAMGIDQRWALFAQADEVPSRLEVAVYRDDAEHLVYRRLDEAHSWAGDLLGYRRVRGAYDQSARAPSAAWRGLARHLLARAVDEHSADALEMRLRRTPTAPPGQPRGSPGEPFVRLRVRR